MVTQCCLYSNFDKGKDQEQANLCLKINAKLGGSNFELKGKLPHFVAEDHVMSIGADINHPVPMNSSCPSIAAVAGTVNWPAVNQYAARVSPQTHRHEKISKFGDIAVIWSIAMHFTTMLSRISWSFVMVLVRGNLEWCSLRSYLILRRPFMMRSTSQVSLSLLLKNTTRLVFFLKMQVMELLAMSRQELWWIRKLFTLLISTSISAAIMGVMGTSKPTHYYVVWEENGFTSDDLQ